MSLLAHHHARRRLAGLAIPMIPDAVKAVNLLQPFGGARWRLATEGGLLATSTPLAEGGYRIETDRAGNNAYEARYQYENLECVDNANYRLYLVARATSPNPDPLLLDIRSEARNEGFHPFTTPSPATLTLAPDYQLYTLDFTTANLNPTAGNNQFPSFFLGQSFPQQTYFQDIALIRLP